jgi:hypothetical protein
MGLRFPTINGEPRESAGVDTMLDLTQHLHKLHPKRLDPSIGAIAGFASAVSVIVGVLAQNAMGHGWHKMLITMHLAKKPMIVSLAPVFTGIAVGIATAAALIRFYNWTREPRAQHEARGPSIAEPNDSRVPAEPIQQRNPVS